MVCKISKFGQTFMIIILFNQFVSTFCKHCFVLFIIVINVGLSNFFAWIAEKPSPVALSRRREGFYHLVAD